MKLQSEQQQVKKVGLHIHHNVIHVILTAKFQWNNQTYTNIKYNFTCTRSLLDYTIVCLEQPLKQWTCPFFQPQIEQFLFETDTATGLVILLSYKRKSLLVEKHLPLSHSHHYNILYYSSPLWPCLPCRPGAFDAGTAAALDHSEALGLILQNHRRVQSQ